MTKPSKLIYDDAAHAYYVDGKRWSGASNYGGQIENQSSLINWGKRQAARGVALDDQLRQEILLNLDDDAKLDRLAEKALTAAGANRSRDRGSEIHRITEQHDKGKLPVLTPDMQAIIATWEQVLEQHGIEVLTDHVERIVVHPEFRVCGTFDRIARYQGRLVVLDLKTGRPTKYRHTMCVQLALLASAPWITRDGIVHGEKVTFTEFDPMPEIDQEIGLIVSMPSDGSEPAVYELPLADGLRAARLAKEAKEWTSKEVGRVLSTATTTPPTPDTGLSSAFAAGADGRSVGSSLESSPPKDTGRHTPTRDESKRSSSVTQSAVGPATTLSSTSHSLDDPFTGIATQEKAAWLTTPAATAAAPPTTDGSPTTPTSTFGSAPAPANAPTGNFDASAKGDAWLTVASTATPSSASDPAAGGETPGAAKTPHDAQRAELQRRIDKVKRNPLATADLTLWWTKLPKWAYCQPEHYADVAAMLDDIEALHEFAFDPPPVELPELPPDPVKPPRVTVDPEAVAAALAAVAALTGPAAAFWNAMTTSILEAGHTIHPGKPKNGDPADALRRLEVVRALLAWCEHHDEGVLRAALALCLGDDAVQPGFRTGALLASLKVGEATALRKVAEGLGSTFVEHIGADGVVELRRVA
jgi:hypothetical protein